jgi:hypothetical protein
MGHDTRFPFIVVGDMVEAIDGHAFGIFRVPNSYVDEISPHVAELWHEVGVQIYRMRYGIGGSLEAAQSAASGSDEIADIADIYADFLVLKYVFHSDLRLFIAWRAWSLVTNPNACLAPANVMEILLVQLLVRCYRVAESHLRAVMISRSVDHLEVGAWRPLHSFVVETVRQIAECVSDAVRHIHFADATRASAINAVLSASSFSRRCMAELELESRPNATGDPLVERYAELQISAVQKNIDHP